MDERIGLVFTWDPRVRAWAKERGPVDAPPPPVDPIDNEAVQTYFLDTTTGKWQATILGMRGRQISVELGDKYRAALMVGLAITNNVAPKRGPVAEMPKKRSPATFALAGAVVLTVLAAGGIVYSQMQGTSSAAQTGTSGAPTATVAPNTSVEPTAAPTSAASEEATAAPTSAPTGPARTATPRTPAPTQPPAVQTVTYSARLVNGTTIVYRGPNSVQQGAALDGVVSVNVAGGAGATELVTIYLGQLGTATTATYTPDKNGNIVFSIKASAAKGTGQLSVQVGRNGEIRTLGPITIR